MSNRRKAYQMCLEHAVDKLPTKEMHRSFKKAIHPYKFNLEIYVPKNLIGQHKVDGGNYLRNRLVTFNDNYTQEKEMLSQMKKDSDEFSKQYRIVTETPTYDEVQRIHKQHNKLSSASYTNINNNNNTRNTTTTKSHHIIKQSKYFKDMLNQYKTLGYNENEIALNENIFKPSLLIENCSNFDRICETEKEGSIVEEKVCLGNLQNYISDKGSELFRKGYNNNNKTRSRNNKSKGLSLGLGNDVELPVLLSTRELQKERYKMNKEIKLTKKTIEEYLRQDNEEEEQMKRGLLSERGKDNKKYVVESMFISSKGMLRSARKGREKECNGKEYNDNNNVHKKNKSVDFILNNNRKEYDNTKTIELVKLYNNINKFGFKNGSSNVNNYLNRYHKDKIKPLK